MTEGDGLDTGVVRLLCNLAGHEGLPDSAISSSFPKSASLRSLMASTILASIFCTEGLNLTGNASCDPILLPALTTLVSNGYVGEGGQYGDGGSGRDNDQRGDGDLLRGEHSVRGGSAEKARS